MSNAVFPALAAARIHSASLLAQAMLQQFPATLLAGMGLNQDGFYYDFSTTESVSEELLPALEAAMTTLLDAHAPLQLSTWSAQQAHEYFSAQGNRFKLAQLASQQEVAILQHGALTDLLPDALTAWEPQAASRPAFRLLGVSGVYWQGDASQPALQRIFGTAWPSQEELERCLEARAAAETRDHRKLGRAMQLFHFADEAPGAVFWHPKGWKLFQRLIDDMRRRQEQAGYVEVNTPDVMDRSLWERSGHWQNYREHMFTTQTEDERIFALKPMNCPGGVLLYQHALRSYRDLPLRIAELGKVHRYEPSGSLHGLMRVRHFTQDDAHIFCAPADLIHECQQVLKLVLEVYHGFGFEQVAIKLSTRPSHRIGGDSDWDFLEQALAQALDSLHLEYALNPGEGAFYGPKIEFALRDAIGRDWQCGTLQVDLNLPERFQLHYINEQGQRQRPVMMHRALFGSLERFIGILLEHYAGHLPFWLAPVQARILTITSHTDDYARQVQQQLQQAGIRAELDLRNEKISYKIRESWQEKPALLIIIGRQEARLGQVTLKWANTSQEQQVLALPQALALLAELNQHPLNQDAPAFSQSVAPLAQGEEHSEASSC